MKKFNKFYILSILVVIFSMSFVKVKAEENYYIDYNLEDIDYLFDYNNYNISKVENLQIKRLNDNQIQLDWSSDDMFISGYEIWRSTNEDDNFELIQSVSCENENMSYIDEVESDINYYYKIRGYIEFFDGYEYGEFSDIYSSSWETRRFSNIIVNSVNYNTIKISWNKIQDAVGYEIWRFNNEIGDFECIKELDDTENAYEDTNLTMGSEYIYKLRAYKLENEEKLYNEFSDIYEVKPIPEAVVIKKISIKSANTVILTWQPVEKADGYIVYYSEGDSEVYKKAKKLKGKNTTTCKLKNLENGTIYNYKIRAYNEETDKKIYGTYSNIQSKVMSFYGYKDEMYDDKLLRIFGDIYADNRYSSESEAKKNMTNITIKVWDLDTKNKKITKTKTLTVNKKLAGTIKQIFDEIYNGYEKFPIHDIGCYNWRGDTSTSEHCIGTAIDINPNENYMINGDEILSGSFWKPNKNPYSIPLDGEVVEIMNKYGFTQGIWGDKKDYMHFSYFGT